MKAKIYPVLAFVIPALFPVAADAGCARFLDSNSTAVNSTGTITLPWRTDYPSSLPTISHAWETVDFKTDWQGYIAAVLSEVKSAGLNITNKKINLSSGANWWISLWMDYSSFGREPLLGLTKERGPDANDLAPGSAAGRQVWAIGWYNAEGAFGLGQVFSDACNPAIPGPVGGKPWTFPNKTASFKLLFTDAPETEVSYLAGSPVVEAMIDPPPGGSGGRTKRDLRLLQVDIAVRDLNAERTQWVFGTFSWQGPRKGDGLFDNLVPVGLMWGNDPGSMNPNWAEFTSLSESRINPALAGLVWQGAPSTWPQRPYPGFQGRPNGPADNLRSSCLSCHALSQWRRHPILNIVPRYPLTPVRTPAQMSQLLGDYFRDVMGGTLADPSVSAIALDYSLQLEAAFTRMCLACKDEKLTGPTPDLCKAPGNGQITRATCNQTVVGRLFNMVRNLSSPRSSAEEDLPPRQ